MSYHISAISTVFKVSNKHSNLLASYSNNYWNTIVQQAEVSLTTFHLPVHDKPLCPKPHLQQYFLSDRDKLDVAVPAVDQQRSTEFTETIIHLIVWSIYIFMFSWHRKKRLQKCALVKAWEGTVTVWTWVLALTNTNSYQTIKILNKVVYF